jgi:hypothetical protein
MTNDILAKSMYSENTLNINILIIIKRNKCYKYGIFRTAKGYERTTNGYELTANCYNLTSNGYELTTNGYERFYSRHLHNHIYEYY